MKFLNAEPFRIKVIEPIKKVNKARKRRVDKKSRF